MEIRERQSGNATIIELAGRLTVNDQPGMLKDAVADVVKRGAREVLLDLSGVRYIDSTRLGELIAAHVTVSRLGGRLKLVATQLSREGIDVVSDLAPDLPPVTVDPSQLRQVVVNLVVNALQAMPGGGTLTVRTLARPGAVVLVVEDEGVGIEADALDQIFLPFFTTKGVGEGTGLGLSVVHGIVSSHGGSIRVESRPGAGARFEVAIPHG